MVPSVARAAVYARVSTADKDQNPETQLLPLRRFVDDQEWQAVGEYVDRAPATDLLRRTAWRELLGQAARRKVDLLVVWRMDRAFRSVLDAATTLERLRTWRVGLRSYQEPWLDTTSPFGEALFHITVAYAQLERGILAERTRAGMDRARRQGTPIGRPPVTSRPDFAARWADVREDLASGRVTAAQAARRMGCSAASIRRLRAAAQALPTTARAPAASPRAE